MCGAFTWNLWGYGCFFENVLKVFCGVWLWVMFIIVIGVFISDVRVCFIVIILNFLRYILGDLKVFKIFLE